MRLKQTVSIIIILCSFLSAYSQMGITSYSIYALGINTSQSKSLSGELKIFTNRLVEDVNTELDIFFNFKPRTYHRFSLGLGANFMPFAEFDNFYSVTIPASLEIWPLKDFRKFSMLFELAPELIVEEDPNLRFLWGIRYSFGEIH